MSVSLTVNGTTFEYPEVGDVSWGPDATDWAVAVTNGVLQKAGGLFLLLDDVDFGANFGLISIYYSTRAADPAQSGVIRLAVADDIAWRNNADNGDLLLSVNASDKLTFNGSEVQQTISVSDTSTIDLTFTANTLSAAILALSITDSLISSSAAIAYSKLNLSGSIVNADISNSAAIARSKIASGTAHRILVNDVSGNLSEASALTNGQLLIGSTGAAPVAASITGTANRVSVTGGAGSITLSAPQDIATTSDVQFGSLIAGTGSIEATAILQATSTTKGFLPPKMTGAQRDAIVSPASGLVIYNTTTNQLNIYNGSSWGAVGGAVYIDNFTGTTITATNDATQVWRYTGGSAQTLSSINATAAGNGTIIEITGTSNDNTITLQHNDAAGGWILNGDWTGFQYSKLVLRLDTTFNRWVEVSRNGI